MWADFLHAARRLRRTPGFTLAAVLVLALGIGVGTAMFSVVNAVMLQPLPYRQPARLVKLEGGANDRDVSLPLIQAWRQRTHSFAAIAFWTAEMTTLQQGSQTDMVEEVPVSKNLFSMLGIPANPAPGEVVLSHALWHLYLHDWPNLVGRPIELDGHAFTVAAILPPQVSFPPGDAALYTLFQPKSKDLQWDHAESYLDAIARLRPGVTQLAAQAEMTGIETQLARQHTGMMGAPPRAVVRSYRNELEGHIGSALGALSAATVLVWLIACFSVAGLLLTRFARRRHELSTRKALGATRWQLARPLLAESVLLGAAAAIVGVALAASGLHLLGHYLNHELPFGLNHVSINSPVIAGLLVLTVISVLAVGVIPALAASAAPAQEGRSASRLRDGLVIGEMALALLLLAGTALMLRTLYALRSIPLGFATRNIVTTPLRFPPHMFAHRDMVASFDRPLIQHIRALPGVEDAALSSTIPLENSFEMTMHFGMSTATEKTVAVRLASPDFTKVFAIPLLAGRFFNPNLDTTHTPEVAVVNQAFASAYFPGQKLIGTKKLGHPIIGILANVHGKAVGLPAQPTIYFSTSQLGPGRQFYGLATIMTDLAVRSRAPAEVTIAGMRSVLHALAPAVAPEGFATMQELVNRSIGRQIFAARLLSLFALAALAIALAGLYGLLAFAVAQRTRELGIRTALGAAPTDILRLVLGRALWLIALGIAAGLALAFALTHLLAAYLYDVPVHAPWSLTAAALLLAACALAAAWLPARRAARISPLEALRCE